MISQFVRDAKKRVAAGQYAVADDALRAHGRLSEHLQLVGEVKPRSPSEGPLLAGQEALAVYAQERPDALSVLTDADHFDGSVDLLRQAHAVGVPTLMKDFIVDERQIACAAHAGASAVLLIERIMEPAQREALVSAAHGHGLEVLLEVFDDTDWMTAESSAADIIGVNARNLDTLDVNLDHARALLQAIDRPSLALSGIHTIHDVRDAQAAGANGALVGTSILRSIHPQLALRSLRRPLAKVCGLTNVDDVIAAGKAGADLAGFVVGAQSPRSMTAAEAAILADEAASWDMVSVLVTPSATEGRAWQKKAGTDLLQAPGSADIQVLSPGSQAAGACVVDTPGHAGGGTGKTHDWRTTAKTMATCTDLRFIAGGLASDNAKDAIHACRASGADASSRLESHPGRKDHDKVHAFVAAVRAA